MSFTRRSFLIGAGSGLSLLVLTACVDGRVPRPTPGPSLTPFPMAPEPAGILRSNWSADPFARGSHSFMTVGSTPEHRQTLGQAVLDRLFFAGEATSEDFAGTVLGARQSGMRAATELADIALSGEKIAVIGAGIAGAEAARVLSLLGYDVVLIEARDRVGGRISTVTSKDWPLSVELGAWRLRETRDATILKDLSDLDIATAPLPSIDLFRSLVTSVETPADPTVENPAASAAAVGSTAITTAVDWAASQIKDAPLSASLNDSGAAQTAQSASVAELPGAELLAQALATLATTLGADAPAISSWFGIEPPSDPEVPEQEQAVLGAFDELLTDVLSGVETYLSTAVVGVAYRDNGVSLRLGTGESLAVDRAIVTVPLGVLQEDSIAFDPLLPFSHRTAITALGMGTADSVWLRFDEAFWATDAVLWNLVGTDSAITTWINLKPITGDAVLVGLVGGDAALTLAELSDDELVTLARRSLAPFQG